MRPGRVFCAVAALAASVFVPVCWGQTERRVSIVPERPLAGSAFIVEVILPGEPAEALVPLEPVLRGPARYTGADVRPGQDGDGFASAVVEYRFVADGAGAIDIVDLSARSGKRLLQFGSWSIDAVSRIRVPLRRYGAWSAPESVLVRELFTITALGPDGNPAACPSFAVEGSLFEPIPGQPGSFRAIVLEPGILNLPRLELGTEPGRFELRPLSVTVQELPARASDVSAVGGPWRLELVVPVPGATVTEDEVVAWELRASGPGWPGLSARPGLTVTAPDGSAVPVGAGLADSGRTGSDGVSFSTLRGAFKVHGPGSYTIRPLPYAWLDASTRTVRQAMAPAVRLTVVAASTPVWNAPEPVAALALAWLTELAARDAAWVSAAEAASRGDWATARLAASLTAGFSDERGALAAASLRGTASRKLACAVAATTFVATGPTRHALALRAEAYAVFLRLERTAFPARGVTAMADAAAASFGNLDRVSYVLPPSGWILIAGLACAATAATLAILVAFWRRRARQGGRLGTALGVLAVLSIVILILAVVSILERTSPRFVSLGGPARAVPSELAAEGEHADAGRTGRVLESTTDWSFVEFDEGGAVWLSARDVVTY